MIAFTTPLFVIVFSSLFSLFIICVFLCFGFYFLSGFSLALTPIDMKVPRGGLIFFCLGGEAPAYEIIARHGRKTPRVQNQICKLTKGNTHVILQINGGIWRFICL